MILKNEKWKSWCGMKRNKGKGKKSCVVSLSSLISLSVRHLHPLLSPFKLHPSFIIFLLFFIISIIIII